MALPLRRIRHCQVAEALLTGPSPDPDEMAYHFQQAGDRRAIEWFVRAGIHARRANAWITAADRFLTAATLLDGDDGHARERGWLLFLAGWLLRFTDGTCAIDHLNEAERLASSADDPALAAYASYARGAIRCMHTDVRRGLRDLETGVEGIDRLIPNQPLLETEAQAMSVIERLLPASEREKPDRAEPAAPDTESAAQPSADPRPGALVNLQRGVLINHYNHSGRYQQVIALGVPFQEEARAALGPNYFETQECWASLHGLGHAYAALGKVDDARHAFALSRRGANAANDQAIVEMNFWSEQLMVLLPYLTDQLDERARLIADANPAWERCIETTITVAGDRAPSELQSDLLEGRWEQARQLATDHLGAPWITLAQEAIVALGVLDHRQGCPDAAWERVDQLLPDGPATKPGNVCFVHAMTTIELAAELALDAGDLPVARRWIEAHGHWLDWNGATLWQADTQLLLARYCMLAGDGPCAVSMRRTRTDLPATDASPYGSSLRNDCWDSWTYRSAATCKRRLAWTTPTRWLARATRRGSWH